MLGAIFAFGIAGLVYASCVGPYCWDESGAYIGGVINDGNGSGLPTASSTTINSINARAVGQEIYCNTCVNNSSTNSIELCVSTSTNKVGYVFVSSTTKVCK